MMFQRINRDDAERVTCVVFNVSGGTLPAGGAVCLDIATLDGVRASKPATATLSMLLGVAAVDIANSAYGAIQTYGYKQSALVLNDASTAIAAGDILIPVNGQTYFARSGASDGKSGFIIAGEAFATATTPAAANKKVFIRAL